VPNCFQRHISTVFVYSYLHLHIIIIQINSIFLCCSQCHTGFYHSHRPHFSSANIFQASFVARGPKNVYFIGYLIILYRIFNNNYLDGQTLWRRAGHPLSTNNIKITLLPPRLATISINPILCLYQAPAPRSQRPLLNFYSYLSASLPLRRFLGPFRGPVSSCTTTGISVYQPQSALHSYASPRALFFFILTFILFHFI